MIDSGPLVDSLRRAVGLLHPDDSASLGRSKGAAYEAFVLHAVGEQLRLNHGWDWHHPAAGPFRFSARSGCALNEALQRYSTVRNDVGWLVPSVTVVGRSGCTHDLDHALVRSGRRSAILRWNRVRGVIECKNENAQGPGAARDLVGLAAELRLGALYRLHKSKPFAVCQFVTAGSITPTALGVLGQWKLDPRPFMTPASPAAAAHIAAALNGAL